MYRERVVVLLGAAFSALFLTVSTALSHRFDTVSDISRTDWYGVPFPWLFFHLREGEVSPGLFFAWDFFIYDVFFFSSIIFAPLLVYLGHLRTIPTLLGITGGVGAFGAMTARTGFTFSAHSVFWPFFGGTLTVSLVLGALGALGGIVSRYNRQLGGTILIVSAFVIFWRIYPPILPRPEFFWLGVIGFVLELSWVVFMLVGGLIGILLAQKEKKIAYLSTLPL